MRLAVLLLLIVPTASAGLEWSGPEEARVGQPVAATYTISDNGALQGHVDVSLEVWLDGFRLVGSNDVHEHDGVFTTVVTPPGEGTLRFVANTEDETVEHRVSIAASDPGPMDASLDIDGSDIGLRAQHPALGWVTVRNDGGLVVSAWDDTEDEGALTYTLRAGDQVDAIVVDHPADPLARGARLLPGQGDPSTTSAAVPGVPPVAACTDVVTDPDSALDDRLAWQAGTDVRVVHLDGPARYRYIAAPLAAGVLEVPTTDFIVDAEDPWGSLTFRPSTVGSGVLVVDDGELCKVDFTVLPAQPTDGELIIASGENPWGLRLDLAAVAGTVALAHYEFDVRVLRTDDDGALAWAGKLHGHAGEASVHLSFLPPGDYVAIVFPSPQGVDTPGVSTTDPDGFTFEFTLPEATDTQLANGTHPPWMARPMPASPETTTPWPGALLVIALALLARHR